MCFQFSLVYFKFSWTFLFQFLFSCKFIVFGFFYFTDFKYWEMWSIISKLFNCFSFYFMLLEKTIYLAAKLIQVITHCVTVVGEQSSVRKTLRALHANPGWARNIVLCENPSVYSYSALALSSHSSISSTLFSNLQK